MVQLDEGENMVKTFFHHPFPFFMFVVKTIIVSLPCYVVATFFQGLMSPMDMFIVYAVISAIFVLIIAYEASLYFLDRLIITNIRIIHVEWKNLFDVDESEAEFEEIQDIETREHGILSAVPFLNYGSFEVATASTKIAVIFHNAGDPESIKHFIYHLEQKPSSIRVKTESPEPSTYDRAYEEESEEAGIIRRGD